MGTDILEALNEIDEANDLESLGHRIHFDPREFVSNNPAPTLEEFYPANLKSSSMGYLHLMKFNYNKAISRILWLFHNILKLINKSRRRAPIITNQRRRVALRKNRIRLTHLDRRPNQQPSRGYQSIPVAIEAMSGQGIRRFVDRDPG